MKFYHAIFIKTPNAVEMEFPDLPGCVTFGDTFEKAYDNAADALAGWLANADSRFVRQPSRYEDMEKTTGEIVPIPLNENILNSYAKTKRVSVTFPSAVLEKADRFGRSAGLNRSSLVISTHAQFFGYNDNGDNLYYLKIAIPMK